MATTATPVDPNVQGTQSTTETPLVRSDEIIAGDATEQPPIQSVPLATINPSLLAAKEAAAAADTAVTSNDLVALRDKLSAMPAKTIVTAPLPPVSAAPTLPAMDVPVASSVPATPTTPPAGVFESAMTVGAPAIKVEQPVVRAVPEEKTETVQQPAVADKRSQSEAVNAAVDSAERAGTLAGNQVDVNKMKQFVESTNIIPSQSVKVNAGVKQQPVAANSPVVSTPIDSAEGIEKVIASSETTTPVSEDVSVQPPAPVVEPPASKGIINTIKSWLRIK